MTDRELLMHKLLNKHFIKEVLELENQNQHTIKQWRIAKEAGLDDIRKEFADIEVEHIVKQGGITKELRDRINKAREEMWIAIADQHGHEVAVKLRKSI